MSVGGLKRFLCDVARAERLSLAAGGSLLPFSAIILF